MHGHNKYIILIILFSLLLITHIQALPTSYNILGDNFELLRDLPLVPEHFQVKILPIENLDYILHFVFTRFIPYLLQCHFKRPHQQNLSSVLVILVTSWHKRISIAGQWWIVVVHHIAFCSPGLRFFEKPISGPFLLPIFIVLFRHLLH